MKLNPKRILAALLAGLMLIPTVSCAKTEDPSAETGSNHATQEIPEEADTGYKPDIEKTDYGCEFNIIAVESLLNWAVADESATGDAFQETIYERGVHIKEYLGVDLVLIEGAGGSGYANDVIRTVQAGDDSYQMVAAACHNGVYPLLTSNALYDFAELEAIDMDAPYWSRSIMEEYVVRDHYLVGYNDFCLANAACLVFNKEMAAKYNLKEPYDTVRNGKWTLDAMISFVSDVAEDNGDSVWDVNDIYGITCNGSTHLMALTIAAGIQMVSRDEDGDVRVAYDNNPEKTIAFLKKMELIDQGTYSFFGKILTETDSMQASFDDGHALVRMQTTSGLNAMRNTPVRFGVLPYPMFDEAQEDYKSLNWNGMIMIPGAVKDTIMVGEVVELLAYYTAPVKTAFYEDLLGSKLSDAPEDAEMLDIIWNTQCNDVCLAVSAGEQSLWDLLYMVGFLCRDGVDQYASYMKTRVKKANKALDKIFN